MGQVDCMRLSRQINALAFISFHFILSSKEPGCCVSYLISVVLEDALLTRLALLTKLMACGATHRGKPLSLVRIRARTYTTFGI
jgi:hypothetical protein